MTTHMFWFCLSTFRTGDVLAYIYADIFNCDTFMPVIVAESVTARVFGVYLLLGLPCHV